VREIKFRAWDKETKEYVAVGFHVIGEVTMFDCIDEYGAANNPKNKSSLERYNDFLLEQFTGLKDKNGVEIYEGDIIKNKSGKIVRIVFWEGSFCIDDPYRPLVSESSMIFLNPCKFWEIIGNIHENPELLEK
jgi:uncharacterized phage protein (TIGR01671 family)